MPSVAKQIKPLLLKAWWVSKRSPMKSIFCYFILPIVMMAMCLTISWVMFSVADVTSRSNPRFYPPFFSASQAYRACFTNTSNTAPGLCGMGASLNISVYPGSISALEQVALFNEFTTAFNKLWEFNPALGVASFSVFMSPQAMEEEYMKDNSKLVGGMVLDFSSFPSHVATDIRISTAYLPAPITYSQPSLFFPPFASLLGGAAAFDRSGFTWIQTNADSIITTIMGKHQTKNVDLPNVNLDRPALSLNVTSTQWPSSNMVGSMPLVMIPAYLSWVFLGPIYLTIVDMVNDRLSKLKEYLKIMGMRELSFWLANMVLMAVLLLPVLLVLIGACVALGFFGPASNTLLGILVLFLFALTSIAYGLFIASVAPTTTIATGLTVIYFVTPFFASILVNIPLGARLCLALIAPMNFQFSMIQLVKMKALAALGPVREIPSSLTAISDYPLAAGFAFFIIDTLLYTFLAWYFAQILGGSEEFGGSPKKWYFLFTKSYWIKSSSHKRATNEESIGLLSGSHVNVDDYDMEEPSDDRVLSVDLSSPSKPLRRDPAHFEPYHGNPTDLRIRTRRLIKRYKGSEVNAVNGLDLDIFQGIYVLLGENGSGKSTTISMLTGLIPLTNGSAEVDGADVSTQLDFVRNSISICPQHDLLSDRLSGAEHLRLFGRLKGVPLDELEARIVDTLNDVGLGTAGDQLVETYSGGMKRSLSLGISLIAHSRVVFIDEASSGMDMEKRRTLWDMLLKKKKEGSTLVLTTHYMEEAEILGDRIGIMHRGNLVREGSLDFLKRELGYQIHTSQPKGSSSSASQANVELLPLSRRDELPEKLKALESAFEHVAVTTPNLEEVFIQLGKSLDKDDASIDNGHGNYSSTSKKSALAIDTPAPAPRSQQILAYWKKRARAETRNKGTLLCFILAPLIITALGLSISRISTHYMNELPKAMQLSKASGDPMSFNFANAHFPTQIPYGSPNSQSFLSDWGSSTPGLEMKYIGAPLTSLSDYLWSGKDSKLANLGGLFVFSQSSSRPDVSGTYHVGIEYNQTDVYSLNRLVNFVDNAIARHYLNLGSPAPNARDQPILGVRSVPFPDKSIKSDDSLVLQMLSNGLILLNTQFAYMICMCFAILGGLVGKQITEDMEKQIVPQLRRLGMASSTFWVASVLFNMGRMIISGLLAMAVVACFKVTIVMGTSFLPFALSTILQACTTVLISVLISKLFTSAASAQRFIPLILILLVMIPSTLQSMMSALSNIYKNPNNPLQTISTIIPLVSPMSALISVVNKIGSAYTASWGTPSLSTVLSTKHTGIPLLVQVAHLIVLTIALAVIEYFKAKIRTTPKDEAPGMANIPTPGVPPAGFSTTNSVHSNGALGLNSSMENDTSSIPLEDSDEGLDEISVQLRHVWKRYRFAQRRAVIDTSLSVPRGICFGLLGPNGAGKSTTISILIGDVSPSGGSYSLDGIEAIGKSQNDLYHQVRLACCLQLNSLYDDMSVKEHIELYLLLRNNKTDFDLDKATREIMQRMKLSPHSHKLAKQLSGGNKRKLCTALAALTFQSIVVLDEPSTGCDPSMRRTLWQVIKAEQAQKALILTTHSMDEADAVCNRIAIMLNGQVVSLGTPQALKAQCGGYELQLRLPVAAASPQAPYDSANQIAALEDEFLKHNFPASILIDRDTSHDGSIVLKYDLGLVPSISAAFAILHSAFKEGRFSDYSLSQMTLGTAYQRLVRQQLDEGPPVFGKQ